MLRLPSAIMSSTHWKTSPNAVMLLPPSWQSAQAVLAALAAAANASGCSRFLSK